MDLVQFQLKRVAGVTLAECALDGQAAVPPPAGHAVQCRVTCEDPAENFKPDVGRIEAYQLPSGPGIRLDSNVAAGNTMSQYCDSLLTKVRRAAPRAARHACRVSMRTIAAALGQPRVHPRGLCGLGSLRCQACCARVDPA